MKTISLFIILLSAISCVNNKTENYDLTVWPESKSPDKIGLRIAEDFLKSPHTLFGDRDTTKKPDHITYPDVCTWLGGMWFAEITQNEDLFGRFEKRFVTLLEEESYLLPVPNHVDNNVFGAIPLELYMKTKQQRYLDLGLKYADAQWTLPENASAEEKLRSDNGYSWQTRLWIDDMFMITAVQAQAYRATGNEKYIERAAREMILYLDKIQLENGLYHHTLDAPFIWGRGNGWMAVGSAEILRALPENNPNRQRIMDGYLKMMASLLQYQADDGMWRQLINEPEAWKETSSTAMFTYALITGVKNGWLEEKTYGAAARKGWLALVDYINENDHITEVCAGTNAGNSKEYYLGRPRIIGDLHGQAPVLWCALALLR